MEIFTYNNFLERQQPGGESRGLSRWVNQFMKRYSNLTTGAIDSAAACAKLCRTLQNYEKSADGQGDLAMNLRGENLVVIARRV